MKKRGSVAPPCAGAEGARMAPTAPRVTKRATANLKVRALRQGGLCGPWHLPLVRTLVYTLASHLALRNQKNREAQDALGQDAV